MHHLHLTIVHFAVALFVAAMICEALRLFIDKEFWTLAAKYNLAAAAVSSFIAVLTGLIDFRLMWMTEFGYMYLKTHMVLGLMVFFVFQLMANYRILFQNILPKSAFTAYLVVGGVGLGLLFGAANLGKTSVFKYGAGVSSVMLNRYETESYLMKLYNLNDLPIPTAEDSLRAMPFRPVEDTLYIQTDSVDQSDQTSQILETESSEEDLSNNQY